MPCIDSKPDCLHHDSLTVISRLSFTLIVVFTAYAQEYQLIMALDYDFEARRELQKQRLLKTVRLRIQRQQMHERLLRPIRWVQKIIVHAYETVVKKSADNPEATR